MNKAIIIARFISIIFVAFFLFYPMNFFSLIFSSAHNPTKSFQEMVMLLLFGYAWLAWAIMALAWALQHQLPRFWPISGCITGVISFAFILPLIIPAFIVLPAVLLAVIFSKYHLHRASNEPWTPEEAR